jgi:hypothetical protein
MIFLSGCPRHALFVVLLDAEGGGVAAVSIEEGETADTLELPYATAESRAGYQRSPGRRQSARRSSTTGSIGHTISISGRGKHDLLALTADQTSKPRNRRVEITVR